MLFNAPYREITGTFVTLCERQIPCMQWTTVSVMHVQITAGLFLFPTEVCIEGCTLSWAFSVVRGISWCIPSPVVVKSTGRSHTFSVQSWLPDTMKDAFILNKNTHTSTEGRSCLSPALFWTYECGKKTSMAAGGIPREGDGAHSISVAGTPGHTVHPTTVTVHLPHTHWPVLKIKTQPTIVIVVFCDWNWITYVYELPFFLLSRLQYLPSVCNTAGLCKHTGSPLRSLRRDDPFWTHPMTGQYLLENGPTKLTVSFPFQ